VIHSQSRKVGDSEWENLFLENGANNEIHGRDVCQTSKYKVTGIFGAIVSDVVGYLPAQNGSKTDVILEVLKPSAADHYFPIYYCVHSGHILAWFINYFSAL
jgi:hypothetical protein